MSKASNIFFTPSDKKIPDTGSYKINEYSENKGKITRTETRRRRIIHAHQSSMQSKNIGYGDNYSAARKNDSDVTQSYEVKQEKSRNEKAPHESTYENDEDNRIENKKGKYKSYDDSDSSSESSSIIEVSDSDSSSDEEQLMPNDRKEIIEAMVSRASTNIKKMR